MFKLVAVIFAVVNGTPSEKPVGVMTYKLETFPTQDACAQFANDEAGRAVRDTVRQMVNAQRGAIVARLGCMEADDNSI